MSAQPNRPDLQGSQSVLAGPPSLRSSFVTYSPQELHFGRKTKKGAADLVQNALNPFIINIILQKLRRKNATKRAISDQIRPFSALIAPFSAPCHFAILSPRRPHFLGPHNANLGT
jgi:hypothetical protein